MSSLASEFCPDDGVVYMLTGLKHAALIVVSVMTLRRHYAGPVHILAGNEDAFDLAERIEQDGRFGDIEISRWQAPTGGGKGLQHANKCHVFQLSRYARTVFLDADTTIHGPINELLPEAGTEEIRLTTFADWKTNGGKIRKRLEQYRDILPGEVAALQANAYPAINTGTFGFTHLSKAYFDELRQICEKKCVFMADELAAQLIFIHHPHNVLDDRWNWSPVYSKRPFSEARIVHYHGSGHCRPDKGVGYTIWPPLFNEAMAENLANIRDWAPAQDRQLRRWMKAHPDESNTR